MLRLVAILSASAAFCCPSTALGEEHYTPPTTTTTLVSASDFAKWEKVAWCETHGNWQFDGVRYDGGLGIERGNWVKYGGHEFASAPHLATPQEQVVIAMRINAGYDVPDQDGRCVAW